MLPFSHQIVITYRLYELNMLQKGKTIIYATWILLLLSLVAAYVVKPEIFTADYLVNFIKNFQSEMLLAYIILTLVRGFFLIPSTPLLLVAESYFQINYF